MRSPGVGCEKPWDTKEIVARSRSYFRQSTDNRSRCCDSRTELTRDELKAIPSESSIRVKTELVNMVTKCGASTVQGDHCYCSGVQGHRATNCHLKDRVCKQRGHLSRLCIYERSTPTRQPIAETLWTVGY